jgi:chromosome segregation ATPase
MSVEEIEIMEDSDPRASAAHIRHLLFDDVSRAAVQRTRRAETSAKALEAILMAQAEESSAPPAQNDMVTVDGVLMTGEDYRSRLVRSLEELKSVKATLKRTVEQHKSDSDNIDSLQSSLERLHALVAEYRKDKDQIDREFTELLDAARSVVGDPSIGLAELKELARSGNGGMSLLSSEREELEAQLANWTSWSEQVTQELTERDQLLQDKEKELTEVVSRMESMQSVHAQEIAEKIRSIELLEQQVEAGEHEELIAEMETKIAEWTSWADSVNEELKVKTDLESRIEELTTQLEQERKEMTYLSESLKSANQKLREAEDRIFELELQSEQSQSLAQDLEKTIVDLQAQVAQKPETDEALRIATEKRQMVSEELAEKVELIRELEDKITEWSDWADQMNIELKSKDEIIRGLEEEEVARTKAQLVSKSETEEALKLARETIQDLQGRIDSVEMKKELSEKNETISELESKVAEWYAWAEEMNAELKSKDSIIAGLEQGRAEDQSVITELRLTEEALRIADGESEKKVCELEMRVSELQSHESMPSEPALLSELQAELSEKETMIRELQHQLQTWANREVEISAKDTAIRESEAQLADSSDLQVELSRKEVLIQDLQRQLASAGDFQVELSAKESTIRELQSQLAGDLSAKEKIIQELESKLSDMQLNSHKDEALMEKQALIQDLESKLVEWSGWADDMKAQLKSKDALIEELQDLRKRVEELELEKKRQFDSLSVELEILKEESSESELRQRVARTELERAGELITELRERIAIGEASEAAKTDEVSNLRNQVSRLAELEAKILEWSEWAETVTAELKERDETENRLLEQLACVNSIQEELEQKSEQLASLRRSHDLVVEERTRLESRAGDKVPVVRDEGLELEVKVLREENDILMNERAELIRLRDRVKELENSLLGEQETGKLISAYQEEISRLSRENADLRMFQ